ncbi:MAG: hypothetical protein WCB51_01990 [Candidatus Dormiibacterota bacterium]
MDSLPSMLRRARGSFRKVPEVTAAFWIAKVLTTGMGEATSDFLVHQLAPIIAVALGAVGLAVALVLQFAARRYNPWIYWLAVAMVAIFGTMAADFLHVELGVPYVVSTAFFSVALVVVFGVWYSVERTLSIHTINNPRREGFYWLTVMTTFALGTAAGDMTATTLHLGYFVSGVLFTILIAVPAVAHRWFGLNAIVAFWFAYIVTRPLGASFADWLGVSHARGGLNWGTGGVSIGTAIIIVAVVAYLAMFEPSRVPLTREVPRPTDRSLVDPDRGTV